MGSYIALLRAINVGGRNKVTMTDLRDSVVRLGFHDVRTVLQTGNLVFRGANRSAAIIEQLLEAETRKRLGLDTAFMVRTGSDLRSIVAKNPLSGEAKRDPSHLVVVFLKQAASSSAVRGLQRTSRGPETIHAAGEQLYIFYPAGIGRSKLTNKLIEDKLATQATGRNWNTVLKLAELAGA